MGCIHSACYDGCLFPADSKQGRQTEVVRDKSTSVGSTGVLSPRWVGYLLLKMFVVTCRLSIAEQTLGGKNGFDLDSRNNKTMRKQGSFKCSKHHNPALLLRKE
ncbi:unnamed protein product, partial [Ectocarpus sp. 12 AP-2014]